MTTGVMITLIICATLLGLVGIVAWASVKALYANNSSKNTTPTYNLFGNGENKNVK